jgi:hypothetical protein
MFKRKPDNCFNAHSNVPHHSPFFTTTAQLKAIPYVLPFALRIKPGQIGSESVALCHHLNPIKPSAVNGFIYSQYVQEAT